MIIFSSTNLTALCVRHDYAVARRGSTAASVVKVCRTSGQGFSIASDILTRHPLGPGMHPTRPD